MLKLLVAIFIMPYINSYNLHKPCGYIQSLFVMIVILGMDVRISSVVALFLQCDWWKVINVNEA